MSTPEEETEARVLYTETVITDHKGNKTKTTEGRKTGGSGQRYYTTTKTKTKTDADGNVTTIEIATTYERPEFAHADGDLSSYKQNYMTPHPKKVPEWEKPIWAKQNVLPGTTLADGRNLEKPITKATERKTPTGFATFTLQK